MKSQNRDLYVSDLGQAGAFESSVYLPDNNKFPNFGGGKIHDGNFNDNHLFGPRGSGNAEVFTIIDLIISVSSRPLYLGAALYHDEP